MDRNFIFGWWALIFYILIGIVLEYFHAIKIDWYLGISAETRRLLLTLSHAHGVLLAILNILFSISIKHINTTLNARINIASWLVLSSCVLLPFGFLLGGIITYGNDPNLAIIFAPIGALALLCGLILTAIEITKSPTSPQ